MGDEQRLLQHPWELGPQVSGKNLGAKPAPEKRPSLCKRGWAFFYPIDPIRGAGSTHRAFERAKEERKRNF
jgi:hypothetical protein